MLENELRDFAPQLQKCEKLQENALSSSQVRSENRKEKLHYSDVQDFHVLVAKTGNGNACA